MEPVNLGQWKTECVWAESDLCSSRRVAFDNSPVPRSHPGLLEPIKNSQKDAAEIGDRDSSESQMLRLLYLSTYTQISDLILGGFYLKFCICDFRLLR